MSIRRSKLNSGHQNVTPSRGTNGNSSFQGIKNRSVIASSRSRLEAIQRRNQEQRQQQHASENRSPLLSLGISPDSLTGNDSENENRHLPIPINSSSPVRSRNSGGDGSSERVYCLCQRYSFGDMIACDNARCEIEWFHFACVDVKTQPKGRWYCPRCRGETSKVKRPDV
ncbi:hypothetical protein Aperf_G00000131593 [Anoplocephala perfoliata]